MTVGAVEGRRITRVEDHPDITPVRTVTLTVKGSTQESWGAPAQDKKIPEVKTFALAEGWTEATVKTSVGRGQRDGVDVFYGKDAEGKLAAVYAPGLKANVSVGDTVSVDGKSYQLFEKDLGGNAGVDRMWAAGAVLFGGIREAASDQRYITAMSKADHTFQFFRVPPNSIKPRNFDARGKEID